MQASNRHPAARGPLFRSFAPAVIEEILAAATPRDLEPGVTLFRQGEPVDALYVVGTGRLKLVQVTADGEEIVVGTVGPGAILAGVALLDQRLLPVTAVALSKCRVLAWRARAPSSSPPATRCCA